MHLSKIDTFDPKPKVNERMVICQGPPGTGKSQVVLVSLLYLLETRRPWMVACSSNEAVNVNARRLASHLRSRHESTAGIYRVYPDVMEAFYSDPDIQQKDSTDPYDDVEDDSGLALRRLPNSYLPHTDSMIRSHILEFLDAQLTGTEMDLFSLSRHIKERILAIEARPRNWHLTCTNVRQLTYLLLTIIELLTVA